MFELDHKESWAPKYWCFWTVVLEKTPESPLECKDIKPVNPKGNQSWTFIGKTDTEVEAPILWPPDVKNWLIGKNPDAGKDWGQEEKGMTEDEMVGWHHWLDGHEFEQAPGVDDGQGSLACFSPWSRKELDTTEQLNWIFHCVYVTPLFLKKKILLEPLATWCEEPVLWERPWYWKGLKAGGKGDESGWDGWMASLTRWTWVWAGSGSWWWTGKPGVLQSMSRTCLSHWTELKNVLLGLPWWLSGKESACQCRKHEFDSWSRKILHA